MAFVKLVKNNAYFKRYQTKYRRRRTGQTDYRARKRLITQDKTKFNTPKYRMIVRISNRYVLTQIAYSTIKGDKILTQATSKELVSYGLPGSFGLKNWTACYATGLLLARRTLKLLGLDDVYKGQEEINGEDYLTEDVEGEKRAFKVCLDVGLQTTSTGARVFGALKGALDGGLFIPHSVRRWPAAEKESMDAELLRKYIFAGHVGEYMEVMEEDDNENYQKHFAKYIESDVTNENMEETWQKVYDGIRKNPAYKKTEKKKADKPGQAQPKKLKKLNAKQRQNRVNQKIKSFLQKKEAGKA
jgi:large subunit ribosomal protein L5e